MTQSPENRASASASTGGGGKRSKVLIAALVAIVDVVLSVAANKYFESTYWKIVVVFLGLTTIFLAVFEARAGQRSGNRDWAMAFRRVVAGRWFWAAASAVITSGILLAVFHFTGGGPATAADSGKPSSAASESAGPTSTTTVAAGDCPFKAGDPGVLPVTKKAGAPADLAFCPALLNGGEPVTGPFTVAGRILGPANELSKLVIVNQADPDTCDYSGNPAVNGFFYARGSTIAADGTWSFRDPLGYDEAVTIARNFKILYAPATSIKKIAGDRAAHGNSNDYAGMESLPGDARIVATFRQAPGKYQGKGSPCKNS